MIEKNEVPIQKIFYKDSEITILREDLNHPEISGNKFYKILGNIHPYLSDIKEDKLIISFGGAFSNHLSALSFAGKILKIPTLGIVRGDEFSLENQNLTLKKIQENGMEIRYVSREIYRNKEILTKNLHSQFPNALIIPEGGTNQNGVCGIKNMTGNQTSEFNYLCVAVGSGGTVAGISKFAENQQKVLGFLAVKDFSLEDKILKLSARKNFKLIESFGKGFGKISDNQIDFMNEFYQKYKIPLDPVYTSKMMMKIFEMVDENYFEKNDKILAIHTGGLQTIPATNDFLKSKNRPTINY